MKRFILIALVLVFTGCATMTPGEKIATQESSLREVSDTVLDIILYNLD